MAPLAALTLVWLGAQQPEGRVQAALEAWARSHAAKLEAPRAETGDADAETQGLAQRYDQALDRARDQLTGGDDQAAQQTLRQLEQALREHPELLQASWLMAERYRLEAQIAARTSGEEAARWRQRADALEGQRAASFGEVRTRTSAPPAVLSVTIVVRGARRHEIFWDGASSADEVSTTVGEHHLVVVRGKRVSWSGWVSALAAGRIDVWIPDDLPCSVADLAGVALAPDAEASVPKGVRCGAWAIAAPGPKRGTLRLAVCGRDQCERAATWAYEVFDAAPVSSEDSRTSKKGILPAWATWTLAGVGVAAATSIVLWRAGVFDRSEPTTKVTYDGSKL
jgi:hypothetical protein